MDDPGVPLVRPAPPRSLRERVEALADATGVSSLRLVAGGVLAALALGAGLWLLRPPPAPAELSLPFVSSTSLPPASTASTEASVALVHVAGAVASPGVHEVPAGARVVDAISAAGGMLPGADAARINLAAPVADGERIYIPLVGEEPPPAVVGGGGGAPGGSSGAPAGPLDLNQADAAALEALPGIGPATAAAILQHREEIGRFTSVEQLLDVRGIGEAKLEQLRPLVRV